jgi:hypothetical protein
MAWFDAWIAGTSALVLGAILLVVVFLAALIGVALRVAQDRRSASGHSEQEGYIVSGVLGLTALLLGFTFSLALDRYEIRRQRVLESAEAIGAAYLQTQLLAEPHRSRIGGILIRYVDNVLVLAKAKPGEGGALLAKDDQLLTELWQATAAGFDSIRGIDFSSTYVSSINAVIDMDRARRAARTARVPTLVFGLLLCDVVGAAAVLGYVLTGLRGRLAGSLLLVLMVLSLLLIIDIDRPTVGGIREPQWPMEDLQRTLARWRSADFDHWRAAIPAPGAQAP